jgi:phosphatidylglycerophosphate synthase
MSTKKPKHKHHNLQNFLALFLIILLIIVCFFWFVQKTQAINYSDFLNGFIIGIIAQTIDGAIGMAYGITNTSIYTYNIWIVSFQIFSSKKS